MPIEISEQIQDNFGEMFNDIEERNNCFFALALAQWETKSLNPKVLKQVEEIIDSGSDLNLWKDLGADEKILQKRRKELDRFLNQILSEKEKPKRRVRPKFEFEVINVVNAVAPDNLKKFDVNEEYTNKKYIHTSGLMKWEQGGGSVLYFNGQGKGITAKWLDSKRLEVTHDRDIVFSMKKERAYFSGDDVEVIYKPQ
jgi:hypothetical protein